MPKPPTSVSPRSRKNSNLAHAVGVNRSVGVIGRRRWNSSVCRLRFTASAHSWVVWASWRDRSWCGISLLEFVCVSSLVV